MNAVTLRMIGILAERFREKGDSFQLEEELNRPDPVTDRQLTEEEKVYVKKNLLAIIGYKESYDSARLLPVSSITDPLTHEDWYDEWLQNHHNSIDSYHWKRLEHFLSQELTEKLGYEKAGAIVRSIDEATKVIMQDVANPLRPAFSFKGLVVGYVQSGKTANFTALIAKAVDAGYRLVIVLAGIHEGLRRQTQLRLDRELTGNREAGVKDNYIDPPGAAHRWNRLTHTRKDFSPDHIDSPDLYAQQQTPTLAVVKKNNRVLKKLITWLSKASPEVRDRLAVLVIDDEADQASIDTNANNPDADLSRTNDSIRKLLTLFRRKTYIGYTATPFANVLIDMGSYKDTHEDDLYPRNFIVSLPEPEGYFGSSMIFAGELAERFVKLIPNESTELITQNEMAINLSVAIDQFILACAVRNLRDDHSKPMSMLVHVTHLKSGMAILSELILDYVTTIRGRYNNPGHHSLLKEQYAQPWRSFAGDASAISEGLGIYPLLPDFEEVWKEVEDVLSVLTVVELNSDSDDKLDYTTKTAIKVIAIGGNQLSRGLTLEGLMISYYLRDSPQYDTLLQMGRWFGYRQGYEDLTRIFTTGRIWESFEHLALVENELRSEIYRYEDEGLTPRDMAVAIRAHDRLKITAPNKMGAARYRKMSYSGSLSQTIWLPLDRPDMLAANYQLGEQFIRTVAEVAGFPAASKEGIWLAEGKVDGRLVMEAFLNRYQFVEKEGMYGPGLDHRRLLDYINRRLTDPEPELTQWSVAFAGNLNPQGGDPVVYGGLRINRPRRSRKFTAKGYNIGVLTEADHLVTDLPPDAKDPYDGRSVQNPLLLLYLIAKESGPLSRKPAHTPSLHERIDLFQGIETAKTDVLGIALVLPDSKRETHDYVGQ